MLVKIAGRVRGFFSGNYPENREDEQLVLNNRGDLCITQSLPELAEVVRLGDSWQSQTTTGVAAATAIPTTTSGFSINNIEPDNGRCYVIDSFGSWEAVVDATQTDVTAIFAMMNKSSSAVASGGTAETTTRSLSGRSNYSGNAVLLRAATVANDSWFPHGTIGSMAPAVAGANWKVNEVTCKGLYIVPPGGSFSIASIKAAAAAAAQQFYFIRWHEVQLVWKT